MRKLWLWQVALLVMMCIAPATVSAYTVSVSTTAGGTINAPVVKGKNNIPAGGSLTVGFTAADGYYLTEVKIDKVLQALPDREAFTKEFPDDGKNHTIAAKFARDPAITASVTAGGTITPPGKSYIPYGTSQSFMIQPDVGYHLTKLVVDGKASGTPGTWAFENVTAKHSLKAFFTINTYPVTTSIVPTPGAAVPGTIVPAMATMKHGQSKTFTIKPAVGMKIAEVTVNGVAATGLPPDGPYQLPVIATSDTEIAVKFAEKVFSGVETLKGTYNLVATENSFYVEGGYVGEALGGYRSVVTFDGKGACTLTFKGAWYERVEGPNGTATVDGEPDGGAATSCVYSVGSEGAVTLNFVADGQSTISGTVSPDGNIFFVGGPETEVEGQGKTYDAHFYVGVKAGAGLSKASVAGKYRLISQESTFWKSTWSGNTYVSDNIWANTITVDFNGAGQCTVTEAGTNYRVDNGAVVSEPETSTSESCSYTVSPTGAMSIKISEGDDSFTATGWFSADGNTFLTGGSSTDSDTGGTGYRTEIITGVRVDGNMSTSSVSGTYRFLARNVEFWQPTGSGTVGGGFSAEILTATFDGNGGCTLQGEGRNYSVQGDTFTDEPQTTTASACSYSVGTDGTLTLTITADGTDTTTGWVAADGNTIVVGGPTTYIGDGGSGYGALLAVGVKVQ